MCHFGLPILSRVSGNDLVSLAVWGTNEKKILLLQQREWLNIYAKKMPRNIFSLSHDRYQSMLSLVAFFYNIIVELETHISSWFAYIQVIGVSLSMCRYQSIISFSNGHWTNSQSNGPITSLLVPWPCMVHCSLSLMYVWHTSSHLLVSVFDTCGIV